MDASPNQKYADHERFRIFFESKDSIMEPGLLTRMKEYIQTGGQPQTMVKWLTENYRGLAQMVNILSEWLKITGMSEKEVAQIVKDHLKQMIIQHFDPKTADSIFEEGGSGAPDWLLKMIKHPEWRSLIYQLAETYRNCLLLNFAIQRISDEGHQNEIASLATASTFFSVFNKVLEDSLQTIFTLDEVSLSRAMPDFKKMCNHGQHTYLYTQVLLVSLMKDTGSHQLKRLMQELEQSVSDKGRIVQSMNMLFSSLSEYPSISNSVIALLVDKSTNLGDILSLYTAYSSQNPPPVEFLRNPVLLDLLLQDLFTPHKPINSAHKSKYIYLLAYAATATDIDDSMMMMDEYDRDYELKQAISALDTVQPICQRNSFGSELQASVNEIRENLHIPIVCMAVLQWIKTNFEDPDYYTSSNKTLCVPLHLEVLREITYRHPLQRQKVLELLSLCFEMETGLDAVIALDLKKILIDNMIFVMQCGYVIPVVRYIQKWAPKTDLSLFRHFIVQLLDIVEPPYSLEFLSELLHIFERPGAMDALKATDKKDYVLNFTNHCLDTEYGLDDKQKSLLQRLRQI